jgi:quercetin dioxygenase-like cupin family protein
MAESEYLAGKVVKWSLPVISGHPGPDAPVLKRLFLPQGELAQVHDSDEGIRYLAVIEIRAGGVRGNHYHKLKEERIYMLRGELLVLVEDVQISARASVSLRTGDLLLIQTGIAHLLRTVEPGQAIEFSKARFNPADIFPFPLADDPRSKSPGGIQGSGFEGQARGKPDRSEAPIPPFSTGGHVAP